MIARPTRVATRSILAVFWLFACAVLLHAEPASPPSAATRPRQSATRPSSVAATQSAEPATRRSTAVAATQPTKPATDPTVAATRPAPRATQLSAAPETIIEVDKAPDHVMLTGPLGTGSYAHTKLEQPFLEKTPVNERTIGSLVDDSSYDLAAHKGKWVSWFGIIRSVQVKGDGYELLIEHKYFDGLTDTHILALSFNGAGDFKVLARTVAKGPNLLRALDLVRVYGTVIDEPGNIPVVRAEFIRVFPWKTFTFLDCYGTDKSNPEWRKLCKIPLDRIYDPRPEDSYYAERLGGRGKTAKDTSAEKTAPIGPSLPAGPLRPPVPTTAPVR